MPNEDKGAPAAGSSPAPAPAAPSGGSNVGMGPRSSDSSSPARPPIDKIFEERGEEIFAHDRFKELLGYKNKYAEVEPFVTRYKDVNGLRQFDEYLGPVWEAISAMPPEKAEGYWSKLRPILQAVVSEQDISPLLAAVQAAAGKEEGSAPDPMVEKITGLESRLERKEREDHQRESQRIQNENFSRYTSLFDAFVDEKFGKEVPEQVRKYLGNVAVNSIAAYLPKGTNGRPINPLFNFDEKAFRQTLDKDVTAAYNALKGHGTQSVTAALRSGSPVIPGTNGSGSSVSGAAAPASRQERAARMAQWLPGNGR